MKINLQSCIDNQKHIDYHPKFGEKPTAEIIQKLEKYYERCNKWIEEFGNKESLSIHERGLLNSARFFVKIATL